MGAVGRIENKEDGKSADERNAVVAEKISDEKTDSVESLTSDVTSIGSDGTWTKVQARTKKVRIESDPRGPPIQGSEKPMENKTKGNERCSHSLV